jgi:hypothetical protein
VRTYDGVFPSLFDGRLIAIPSAMQYPASPCLISFHPTILIESNTAIRIRYTLGRSPRLPDIVIVGKQIAVIAFGMSTFKWITWEKENLVHRRRVGAGGFGEVHQVRFSFD